ncbi:hypothetical protein BC831DRAFT_147294 [Entophlyctis helioformis]|nr:hypothetical protein BC831DRAFT_147294 [Entophlyctis helioformis]
MLCRRTDGRGCRVCLPALHRVHDLAWIADARGATRARAMQMQRCRCSENGTSENDADAGEDTSENGADAARPAQRERCRKAGGDSHGHRLLVQRPAGCPINGSGDARPRQVAASSAPGDAAWLHARLDVCGVRRAACGRFVGLNLSALLACRQCLHASNGRPSHRVHGQTDSCIGWLLWLLMAARCTRSRRSHAAALLGLAASRIHTRSPFGQPQRGDLGRTTRSTTSEICRRDRVLAVIMVVACRLLTRTDLSRA